MARATETVPARTEDRDTNGLSFAPPLTLALWQLRQAWRLLLIVGTGMLAAVVLVCAIPLYTQLSMTAGLRGVLTSSSQNADIVVRSSSKRISSSIISTTTRNLNAEFQKQLGSTLITPQFSLQTQYWSLSGSHDVLALYSATPNAATAHLRLLQGRLPFPNSDGIEIAIRPDTANLLHIGVGSVLKVKISFIDASQVTSTRMLAVQVVGLFTPTTDDTFWHGNDFRSVPLNDVVTLHKGLVSTGTILSALTRLGNTTAAQGQFFFSSPLLWWYYRFDTAHITVDDLDTMASGVNAVQIDNANNPELEQSPYIQETVTYLPSDILQRYQTRVAVARLPVFGLLVLVLALLLFFVSTMVNLLVERQSDAIAVIRSRGASTQQVFASLVLQSLALGLIVLLVGPFLALLIVYLLILRILPSSDVLNVLTTSPVQVALGLGIYALIAAGVAVLTMVLALRSAIRFNVVTRRADVARSTRTPVWQRLNLDILAAILALGGYGFSLYVTNSGAIDPQLRLFLLSPLTLVESVLLLLACMLFLLRFFPRILQLGAWFALRGRGAAAVLALAQMARSPRSSVRMALLLAFATAFAIFTLIFLASQAQRVIDVADYSTGADFSGMIPGGITTPGELAFQTANYRRIRGVTAASLGYLTSAEAGDTGQTPIDFKAVDADTFASTIIWTQQDSEQSLAPLMAQLAAQRQQAIARKVVPAIVDAATWDTLHLSPGATFTLNFALVDYSEVITFTAIARVEHIPTPGDTATPGVLADYTSFSSVYNQKAVSKEQFLIPLNFVWLRTTGTPAALKSVRTELTSGNFQLDPIYDRQATLDDLHNDPLYLTLLGLLGLGATIALLLALAGNLIASWLSASGRRTNFAVLRALGSSQRQIASVLLWEQSILLLTALVLGLIFGALLAVMVLPALLFTSVPSNETNGPITKRPPDVFASNFFAVQSVPPISLVLPPSLYIVLAVLIAICLLAIGMMVRIVFRPSMAQVLRLNED